MDDFKKVAGMVAAAGTVFGTSTATVATITTPAAGILGLVGFTTTTVVALPLAGVAAVTLVAGCGLKKGWDYLNEN
jgi:uncharacterized membrane protein YphA (DoxX/SURF4 family)